MPVAKHSKPFIYMAKLKGYIDGKAYQEYRERYTECVRMLNGMERTLERQLGPNSRSWPEPPSPEP